MTLGTCSCGEVFRDDNPLNPPNEVILLHSTGGHSVTLWNQGCGRKLGPFDCCSVVQGDWFLLVRDLPRMSADVVFADPPYGIDKAEWDGCYPHGFERAIIQKAPIVLITPGQWALQDCISALGHHFVGIVSGRNLNGMTFSPLGFGNWIPTVVAGFQGKIPSDLKGQDAFEFTVNGDKPEHPSPKPLEFMEKLVERFSEIGQTILDPFLGSGTTAVAARKLGRHFLGFEISPEYCEIARRRIALTEAQPSLFEAPATQEAMFPEEAK